MPRVAGQVDEAKTEAILDAAAELVAEHGIGVSMERIARKAGVSRQTLYNRFATRLEIARAIASRNSEAITAPLRAGGDPEAVLTAFAVSLLEKIHSPTARMSMRGVALMSPEAPEVATTVYEAGPGEGLKRLAAWLADQDAAGRLRAPDPRAAAEMFVGLTLGHGHLRAILGVPQPTIDIPARAAEAARRFLKAFAA